MLMPPPAGAASRMSAGISTNMHKDIHMDKNVIIIHINDVINYIIYPVINFIINIIINIIRSNTVDIDSNSAVKRPGGPGSVRRTLSMNVTSSSAIIECGLYAVNGVMQDHHNDMDINMDSIHMTDNNIINVLINYVINIVNVNNIINIQDVRQAEEERAATGPAHARK